MSHIIHIGIWQQAKKNRTQINSVLANSIVDSMNTRQEQLMDNNVFVAGNIITFFTFFLVATILYLVI